MTAKELERTVKEIWDIADRLYPESMKPDAPPIVLQIWGVISALSGSLKCAIKNNDTSHLEAIFDATADCVAKLKNSSGVTFGQIAAEQN